ncbi:MAG: type I polyketide synthase, partial [Cellvibrio sp.]
GDKAETSALNKVFSSGRNDKLIIGSVKTNIGHLEAAAGVSGLLKAILCLKNGKIPANLNFETPNPEIPFDTMCLKVPTETQEWPRKNKTKYIGVNGFGYGGTNAHIIISEAPQLQNSYVGTDEDSTSPLLLPLSAKSNDSLKALAGQYKDFLESGNVTTGKFLRRVSTKRNHYDRRALIFASNKQELLERLELFSKNTPGAGIVSAEPASAPGKLTFVYSGMGPQWWGMGQELLISEPLFAQKIKEYDEVFQKISGWSLLEEMQSSEENSRVAKTDVAQPMNFAVQAALTEVWRSWGIEPDAVVGHSVGEVTSAYVSGILSLEEALLVSYHRSRLQGSLANTGGMLAVGLSEKAVQTYLSDYPEHVSIAAINSPHAVTLAGQQASLDELAAIFQQNNIFNRALQVEVPYHSPLMAPIEAEIKHCLASIKPQQAKIPCYSTVSGELAQANDYDADYWWHNVRESVQFAKTIETLCENDLHSFLEVGPHPVLNSSMKEILSEKGIDGHVYSSLNRKTPEQATLLNSLGLLYAHGYELNWNAIQKAEDSYFQLPTYPWQKSPYTYGSPKFFQD